MGSIFGTSEAIVVGAGTVFQPIQRVAPPPSLCITDTFTRTVTDGWGTSDSGFPWAQGATRWTVTSSTDGTEAIMTAGPGGSGGANWSFNVMNLLSALAPGYTYVISYRFKVGSVNSTDFYFPFFIASTTGGGPSIGPGIRPDASNTFAAYHIEIFDDTSTETAVYIGTDGMSVATYATAFHILANQYYWTRMSITAATPAATGTLLAKVWADGNTEPSGWATYNWSLPIAESFAGANTAFTTSMGNVATSGTLTMWQDDFSVTTTSSCGTTACALEAWSGVTTNISGSVASQSHSTGSMTALCGTFGGSYGLQVTTSFALPTSISAFIASDTFPSGSAYSAGQFIVTSSNGQSFTVTCRLGSTGLSSLSGSGGTWTGPVATSDWTVGTPRQLSVTVNANGTVSAFCEGQTITRSGTGLSDVLTIQFVVLTSVTSGYSATVSMSSITVCH